MGKTGRPAREFRPSQIDMIVHLFNRGVTLKRIGEMMMPPCHHTVLARVLTPILGPLPAARRQVQLRLKGEKQLGDRPEEESGDEVLIPMDYRERYHAGYAMALTHMAVYGLDACHEHCYGALLNWRDNDQDQDDDPPALERNRT